MYYGVPLKCSKNFIRACLRSIRQRNRNSIRMPSPAIVFLRDPTIHFFTECTILRNIFYALGIIQQTPIPSSIEYSSLLKIEEGPPEKYPNIPKKDGSPGPEREASKTSYGTYGPGVFQASKWRRCLLAPKEMAPHHCCCRNGVSALLNRLARWIRPEEEMCKEIRRVLGL